MLTAFGYARVASGKSRPEYSSGGADASIAELGAWSKSSAVFEFFYTESSPGALCAPGCASSGVLGPRTPRSPASQAHPAGAQGEIANGRLKGYPSFHPADVGRCHNRFAGHGFVTPVGRMAPRALGRKLRATAGQEGQCTAAATPARCRPTGRCSVMSPPAQGG